MFVKAVTVHSAFQETRTNRLSFKMDCRVGCAGGVVDRFEVSRKLWYKFFT